MGKFCYNTFLLIGFKCGISHLILYLNIFFKFQSHSSFAFTYDTQKCASYKFHKINDLNELVNGNHPLPSSHLLYDSLKKYHDKVIENMDIIITEVSITKELKNKLVLEAEKNLNSAKLVVDDIENLIIGKRRKAYRNHFKEIKKLYLISNSELDLLKSEINKSNPSLILIKLYAAKVKETVLELNRELLL